jgi:hypothetical protein
VAALTSQNRRLWAQQRAELRSMDPVNRNTLDTIESALFVVALDDSRPERLEELCHMAMHRHGRSVWFDKNFNQIYCNNGRIANNVELTWGEAATLVHMYDFCFSVESSIDRGVHETNSVAAQALPIPQRLEWRLTPAVAGWIATAQSTLAKTISDIEIKVLEFNAFGKALIKRAHMSPDAFSQMAIQLAYYRLHGEAVATVEMAGMVRFLRGRTENLRTCSAKSLAFVKAMDDKLVSMDQKLNLLNLATRQHVRAMRAATNGDAFDTSVCT